MTPIRHQNKVTADFPHAAWFIMTDKADIGAISRFIDSHRIAQSISNTEERLSPQDNTKSQAAQFRHADKEVPLNSRPRNRGSVKMSAASQQAIFQADSSCDSLTISAISADSQIRNIASAVIFIGRFSPIDLLGYASQ